MATKKSSFNLKRKVSAIKKTNKTKNEESTQNEEEKIIIPSGVDMGEFYDYSSSEDESDNEDTLANNADKVNIDKKQKSGIFLNIDRIFSKYNYR